MRAIVFFRQVAVAERDLQRLQAARRHYEDLGLTITPRLGGVVNGGSHGSSRVETSVIGKIDAEAGLDEKIAFYQRLIQQAENVIARIPGEKFRQILTLHYLAGWSWSSITDELRYSDRSSVYKAHGYALREAQKVLNKMGGEKDG